MITLDAHLAALSSPDLLAALDRTAAEGREVTADLIALLVECDTRKLYAVEGYESLFEFSVRRLRLSESQAYHRIQAARAARDFPLVLERLRAGRVTMTAVALLRDHLTETNCREVIDWAEGRRKREVEIFIRARDPRPDVPFSVRRLPPPPQAVRAEAADNGAAVRSSETVALAPSNETLVPPLGERGGITLLTEVPSSQARTTPVEGPAPVPSAAAAAAARPATAAPGPRAEIRPLSPARYSLHVTISQETHDKLRRAQDLLARSRPVDPGEVLDRALTLLVARLERKKAGAAQRPQRKAARRPSSTTTAVAKPADTTPPAVAKGGSERAASGSTTRRRRSRHIPAAVRRAVWERDGARCAYVSPAGIRCCATSRLEFHHRIPFSDGGATSVENLALTCKRHNLVEAERWFNFDWTKSRGRSDVASKAG